MSKKKAAPKKKAKVETPEEKKDRILSEKATELRNEISLARVAENNSKWSENVAKIASEKVASLKEKISKAKKNSQHLKTELKKAQATSKGGFLIF